jgi:hypothetical protein
MRGQSAERREQLSAPTISNSCGSCWEHIRDGFPQFDAGEIDEFDLDLIHRYKRAANELWKFCGNTGGQWLQGRQHTRLSSRSGEEPDWWAGTASRG